MNVTQMRSGIRSRPGLFLTVSVALLLCLAFVLLVPASGDPFWTLAAADSKKKRLAEASLFRGKRSLGLLEEALHGLRVVVGLQQHRGPNGDQDLIGRVLRGFRADVEVADLDSEACRLLAATLSLLESSCSRTVTAPRFARSVKSVVSALSICPIASSAPIEAPEDVETSRLMLEIRSVALFVA